MQPIFAKYGGCSGGRSEDAVPLHLGILGSDGRTDEWTDFGVDELGPSGPRGGLTKLSCSQHPYVFQLVGAQHSILLAGAHSQRHTHGKKVCSTHLTGMNAWSSCDTNDTCAGWLHNIAALQVVSKPHHTLVTLLLCNAVALEVRQAVKCCIQASMPCSVSKAHDILGICHMQALPIFLDRLVDPVAAVVLSVTVVLFFGKISNLTCPFAK